MAYGRTAHRGSWFQEQQSMINNANESDLMAIREKADTYLEAAVNTMKDTHDINVTVDFRKMLDHPEIMQEYKTLYLDPICDEIRNYPTESEVERVHLESVASELSDAWDGAVQNFIQESYNVSTYLPLSTLDFPALVKQFIKFLGKDIIPVATAGSTNIEQRIFTKYLVNNETGEEYETPRVYFDTELWKKLWYTGKGLRIDDTTPILLSAIAAAPGKKLQLLDAQYLLDENGNHPENFTKTPRTRLSYDFHIKYVVADVPASYVLTTEEPADWETNYTKYYTYESSSKQYTAVTGSGSAPAWAADTYYSQVAAINNAKIKLPKGGIQVDIQNNGVFLNGGVDSTQVLSVVDPTTNKPTGRTTSFDDRLSGVVDFVKGYVNASACGTIKGFYINGYISNETNLRTIGFREYPEIRKWTIGDGCRFQLPFTVEDFAEANASLNFNLYNRLVQELVTAQEMFEDQYILEKLDEEFNEWDGADSNIWALDSYTHTEYVDFDPTFISPSFAGDPFEYRTNALHNAIASTIYELCDKGKLDNLGFVIYSNPKSARLLEKFVTWTTQQSTEIGGVKMNHAFGVMTDESVPIRVVASNRVPAYTLIDAYQTSDPDYKPGMKSKEYFWKIVAYPMDKFHITHKHLRFARHLTNSPENAGYQDPNSPGGQAVLITTSSQYQMITVQGVDARIIAKNTALVPDSNAGLVK